jgi:hypothetical protein
MRLLLKAFFVVSLTLPLLAQAPQIPVTGTLGSGGAFPLIVSPAVVFTADADKTMAYPEMSGSSGVLIVTSTATLTATRNLTVPGSGKYTWPIKNSTTGGQSFCIGYSAGSCVTVAAGATMTVVGDGTNFTAPASGSGGGVSSVNTRTGAVTIGAADVNAVGAITNSTSGNAGTASALAAAPTPCSGSELAGGVDVNGNSIHCAPAGGGSYPLYNASGTLQTSAHTVIGTATVSSNVTVTLSGSAVFTSASSYACTYSPESSTNGFVPITYTSGSAFVINGDTLSGFNGTVRYICTGN